MILQDLYTIEESSKEGYRHIMHLSINKNHEIYKGHFPGRPVTPGVVLMHFFKEQAQLFTDKSLQLTRASNVKFSSVFDPTQNNSLTLESEFEISEDFINLKGVAKTKETTLMKITALYKVL